jgi:hypothetical protein
MISVRSHHDTGLDRFDVLALIITLLLCYAPSLAARQLFGPFPFLYYDLITAAMKACFRRYSKDCACQE